MVDCGGLENRYTLTGIVGSNPTASANSFNGLEAKSSKDSERYFKQKRRLMAVLVAVASELRLPQEIGSQMRVALSHFDTLMA